MGGGQAVPWAQGPVGNQDHTEATVVIIGAGISGLCTAIDLVKRNNCQNFVILEKSSGVGGTWRDNKYPGCCCDVWSLLYSFSFEQNPDWSRLYPGQEEILDYLRGVAEKYQLYKHIRFNTSVDEAYWDGTSLKWKTKVSVSGSKDSEYGDSYTLTSDFLVSAVGQLNTPSYPSIPGIEDFQGKMMHSARWDWSYKLEGKRIAIIGNGASAVQILPEIAKVAAQVTMYQRTPNWVTPRMDRQVSTPEKLVNRYVPPLRWRLRGDMMDFRESFFDGVFNPESQFTSNIKSWHNTLLTEVLGDRPDLMKLLTPDYSPGCKRVLISDDFFPALKLPNVSLETRQIHRITDQGIEVEGEIHEDFDLIVLATGFRTVEFMHPIKITGANGRSLEEIWKGGAQAYYGITVDDLPNFGMLYGPNTNLGHNSIILMIEAQSRYINALVEAVIQAKRQGKSLAITPKKSIYAAFNKKIQELLQSSSFADPRCNSWYKVDGNVTNNWSGTVVEYQKSLSSINWADYDLEGDGKSVLDGKKETHIGRVREETYVSYKTMAIGALGALAVTGGLLWRNSRRIRLRAR